MSANQDAIDALVNYVALVDAYQQSIQDRVDALDKEHRLLMAHQEAWRRLKAFSLPFGCYSTGDGRILTISHGDYPTPVKLQELT